MNNFKIAPYTKVIVTGGAGFIGSHWVDHLINKGLEVVVIDNLSTGLESNLNKKSKFFKEDIANYPKLKKIFKYVKPDIVYNLAANTNVPLSVNNPLFDFKTLQGGLNVIDLCKTFNVKKIIQMSSGFIYGDTKNRPIKETEPFKPLSPYGISKKCIEDYLLFYCTTYNVEYVIIRPATVYGPRQIKGALADYINKLANNTQAEIYGNGSKTRDYIFIEDLLDALVKISDMNIYNNVFNVSTRRETSLKSIYFSIAKLLNKRAQPIYKPDRPGELQYYSSDYTKLNKATGWKPKTSLNVGLKKTIQWWGY